MTAAPIHDETIPMRTSAFKDVEIKAAIDRGCSLTKVLFVAKDAKVTDAEYLPMRCLTFLNKDFEDALRVMKEQADLPASGKLHVTGVGCANELEKIKEIMGLDVEFISEFSTIGTGPFFLITNAEEEDIFFPKPEVETLDIQRTQLFENMVAEFQSKLPSVETKFPALLFYVGSGSGLMMVTETGANNFSGGCSLSGRPFLGLAKILVGTNKYDEVVKLAENGDHDKADELMKDLLKDNEALGEQYGKYPPNMPALPFGKAGNDDWKRENCSKEDLALSLIFLFAKEMASTCSAALRRMKLRTVYFGGNFFRAEIIRKQVYMAMQLMFTSSNLKFLKTGHTGAIAAMLLKKENERDYILMNR